MDRDREVEEGTRREGIEGGREGGRKYTYHSYLIVML